MIVDGAPVHPFVAEVIEAAEAARQAAPEHNVGDTIAVSFRPRECSKGWAKRCAASKGARCRCACGGAHHGALQAQLVLFVDDPAGEHVSAEFAAARDRQGTP